ncbi:MAG: HNH endonuclease [Nitrosomonas ureae]
MQNNNCFYCQSRIRTTEAVDHFIPWSRYPRNITQDFDLAHENCNRDKSELLAVFSLLISYLLLVIKLKR